MPNTDGGGARESDLVEESLFSAGEVVRPRLRPRLRVFILHFRPVHCSHHRVKDESTICLVVW
jgi:hypothetical protein